MMEFKSASGCEGDFSKISTFYLIPLLSSPFQCYPFLFLILLKLELRNLHAKRKSWFLFMYPAMKKGNIAATVPNFSFVLHFRHTPLFTKMCSWVSFSRHPPKIIRNVVDRQQRFLSFMRVAFWFLSHNPNNFQSPTHQGLLQGYLLMLIMFGSCL